MKKIISTILIFTMILGTTLPGFAEGEKNFKLDEESNDVIITLFDGTTLTEEELLNYLNEHADEIIELPSSKMLNDSMQLNNYTQFNNQHNLVTTRSAGGAVALIEGTWYIPGIGEIVIAGAVIYIGGIALIKTGSWTYKQIVKFFEKKAQKKIDKIYKSIPSKLKGSDGYVDLDKFTEKVSGKKSYKDPKTGWVIDKDTSGHGGRKWKLKNKKGKRVGSLSGSGKILGK